MISINRVAALAALTLTVGTGALTGCAGQHHANVGQATGVEANNASSSQTSNTSQAGSNQTIVNGTGNSSNNSSNSTSGNKSKFPYIVTQAMESFPADIVSHATAPTVLPIPQNGDALSFKTSKSTTPTKSQPAYQSMYDVLLQSSKGKIGQWSEWTFASTKGSAVSVSTIGGSPQPTSKSVASVVLSKNQNANVYHDKKGGTTIYWKQDGWNINVTEEKSEVGPTPIADDVTNYFAGNQMPSGGGNAVIHINTTDGTNSTVDAQVTWQNGKTVESVEVTGHSANPVATALAMAASMQPYS